jgi:hypothetical protein
MANDNGTTGLTGFKLLQLATFHHSSRQFFHTRKKICRDGWEENKKNKAEKFAMHNEFLFYFLFYLFFCF